jgi:hypothetical protein
MAERWRIRDAAARELAPKLVGMTENEARAAAERAGVGIELVRHGVGIRGVRTGDAIAVVRNGRIVNAIHG